MTVTHIEPPERTLHDNVTIVVHVLMGLERIRQRELATRMKLTEGAVSAKLRGDRQWSIEDLQALARAFRVEPELFVRSAEQSFPLPRRDSNTQPAVLATTAQVIDLGAYRVHRQQRMQSTVKAAA